MKFVVACLIGYFTVQLPLSGSITQNWPILIGKEQQISSTLIVTFAGNVAFAGSISVRFQRCDWLISFHVTTGSV